MFADMQDEHGIVAPKVAAALPAELVGDAVIDAIEKDLPEVIVMRGPTRAIVAASHLVPRLFERFVGRIGLAAPFRAVVAGRHR